jgi:hypothetical protein
MDESNTCENCGRNTLEHYDGWLGYESMICQNKECNAVYDHAGKWLNDKLVVEYA